MCRMPIGIDDFRMLREEDYYFVDKTHFIKSLIDYHAQVTLITRPRRFGKTLMLSMLQEFFDINAAGGNLFDGLKIVQAGDFYMEKQGKYPVIFISLKDMGVGNFKKTMCMLRAMLSDLYKQFSFLLEADVLSEDEKGYFEKIKQADEYMVAEFAMSLSRLSEYLCRYYGVKPIVLIDEYDAPVQYAWEHGFYDEMIVCMRPFYSKLLKSNKNLEFAVLTGVLRVAKESIFSGLNNLHICSVLENDYGDVFGFTPDEVQGIAAQLDREDKLPELKEWYDGYLFGGKEIYNPWSVIKYFQNDCKLGAYWVNTSENGIIKYLLQDLDGGSRADLFPAQSPCQRVEDAGLALIVVAAHEGQAGGGGGERNGLDALDIFGFESHDLYRHLDTSPCICPRDRTNPLMSVSRCSAGSLANSGFAIFQLFWMLRSASRMPS